MKTKHDYILGVIQRKNEKYSFKIWSVINLW